MNKTRKENERRKTKGKQFRRKVNQGKEGKSREKKQEKKTKEKKTFCILARYPLSVIVTERSFEYWIRINKLIFRNKVYSVYLEQCDNRQLNKNTWTSRIKQ